MTSIDVLQLAVDDLVNICSLTEASLVEALSQSQAVYLQTALKEHLFRVEGLEVAVVSSLGAASQTVVTSSTKAKARSLIVACASIVDKVGSPNAPAVKNSLPRIEIPRFNGDFLQWDNFWGLFDALVHSRVDVPIIVKFHYLLQAVVDEPKELIRGLQVNASNYSVALGLLQDRYNDQSKVKHLLLHQFHALPTPKHNYLDLKQFYSQSRQLYLQITQSPRGFDADEVIKSVLLQKVTRTTYEAIVHRCGKLDFSLTEFFNGIFFLIDLFERGNIHAGELLPVKTVISDSKTKFSDFTFIFLFFYSILCCCFFYFLV